MKQYLVLRASAGSGKTFALALRYVYLLCKGAKPYEILTLTFTNKASCEMRHRISQSLKKLLKDAQEGTLAHNDFFQELQKNGISEEFIRQNIARIYGEFTHAHTRITTLDSFFYTILQKFCWYVGVASDFEIGRYPRQEVYEQFLRAFDQGELQKFARFCYRYFNKSQKIGDFLDILWRYNELEGVFSHFVSNGRLEEIQAAIESKVASLKQYITNIDGISPSGIKAFDYTDIESLISKTWVAKGSQYHYFKKLKIESLDSEFAKLRELLRQYLCGKESEIFARVFGYITRFKRTKNAYLGQTNVLNYDDITYKVLELLHTHEDRAFFYFRLDDKIMHILLDEFQDTSIVQYQILSPLIEEITSGKGRSEIEDRSVFVVGDTKQSIYGFRGGFSAVFEAMARREGFQIENLDSNYRSSKVVLDFINATFSTQYGASYIPQKLPKNNQDSQGYVSVQYTRDSDPQEMCDEVCAIVYHNVRELLDKGARSDDIAILVFTNQEVESLRDFLKQCDPTLPIIAETSQNFFDTFPCNVLINALHYAHTGNPLYRYNIAKLLGKELSWIPPLPTPLYAYKDRCAQYVYEVIESLHLGCAATMQFLEQACGYRSIEEFLQVYASLDVSAPKESAHGIRIMTIHKSKGLEFRHVILSDSLKKGERASLDKILYEYDGIDLTNAYYIYKDRESVDSAYKVAKDTRSKLDDTERLNQLYVAFTRAEQSLMIVCKAKKSRFERLGLEPCAYGTIESSINHSIVDSNPTQPHKNPFTPLPALGRQEDFVKAEQASEIREFSIESVMFGKALHSYFEYLLAKRCGVRAHMGDAPSTSDAQEHNAQYTTMAHIVRNLYGFVLDENALTEVQNRFVRAIEHAEFRALCGSYEIHTEVSYIHNGRIFRIDALLCDEREIVVLDYKSSYLPRDEHFAQVREYVRFLHTISGKPTRGYLIYPANAQMCVALQEDT